MAHVNTLMVFVFIRLRRRSSSSDGLRDRLRDVPWEDIFKLGAPAAASELCEWVRVGIDVISFIENIRSSLIHFHGFQLLLLLP